jgi:hypothetical protein
MRGHPGLNRGPLDLQSNALPLSYTPYLPLRTGQIAICTGEPRCRSGRPRAVVGIRLNSPIHRHHRFNRKEPSPPFIIPVLAALKPIFNRYLVRISGLTGEVGDNRYNRLRTSGARRSGRENSSLQPLTKWKALVSGHVAA